MTKSNYKKVQTHLEQLREIFESENEAFDSKSEKWQESEKGVASAEALECLEMACDYLDEIQETE